MNVLILGAYGVLGTTLSVYLENKGHKIIKLGRTEKKAHVELKKLLIKSELKVDSIINLVALTNVDKCEESPLEAYFSNAFYLKELSDNFDMSSIHFIYISTDQVYQGKGPHDEKNHNPINIYGLTKYIGEIYAKELNSTILRINYVGKSQLSKRNSFSDWIFKSLKESRKVIFFDDIFFNPLEIWDLCKYINLVLNKKIIGTFNLGSNGSISKADFALGFAKALSLDISNASIGKSNDQKRIAKRPNDMVMNVDKFQDKFDVFLPSIEDTIIKLVDDYSS